LGDSSLPFERGRGVQMTDGDGERIGGVGGFGDLIELEETGDHLLDLMFFRFAVADNGGLDGERRVLGNFKAGGSRGQHGHSPNLPELEGRLNVHRIEDVFDGNAVGMVSGDEILECARDSGQAHGHRVARRNMDGTAGDEDETFLAVGSRLLAFSSRFPALGFRLPDFARQFSVPGSQPSMTGAPVGGKIVVGGVISDQIHDAVSGVFGAAIDAEDAHAGSSVTSASNSALGI